MTRPPKSIGEKRKLYLTLEFQLIKVKEIIEIENHHLETSLVIIVSGKTHQWICG